MKSTSETKVFSFFKSFDIKTTKKLSVQFSVLRTPRSQFCSLCHLPIVDTLKSFILADMKFVCSLITLIPVFQASVSRVCCSFSIFVHKTYLFVSISRLWRFQIQRTITVGEKWCNKSVDNDLVAQSSRVSSKRQTT